MSFRNIAALKWLEQTKGSEKYIAGLKEGRLRAIDERDFGKTGLPCYILSYYRSGAIKPHRQLVGAALSYIDVSPVGNAEVGIYVRQTENPRLAGAVKRFRLGKGYILVLCDETNKDKK